MQCERTTAFLIGAQKICYHLQVGNSLLLTLTVDEANERGIIQQRNFSLHEDDVRRRRQ